MIHSFSSFSMYAGIDWGSQSHQACIRTSDGTIVGEQAFPHSGEGLAAMCTWILSCAGCAAERVAVAIEVPHGPVVDSLMDRGFPVFSINPKQLDRFRDRHSPSGAKDDRRDARVLAGALHTDPDSFRAVAPMAEELVQLREYSRVMDALVKDRTRLVHRFRGQLQRYYPQFLGLKESLYAPWLLALWTRLPTPRHARRVRVSTVATLLRAHRIRRLTAEEVLQILRGTPITVAAGVCTPSTYHIDVVVTQLTTINQQIRATQKATKALLTELCAEASTPEETSTSSSTAQDAAILASLPGVGPRVLSTLMAEASLLLATRDYQALRCLCGVAPVTRRSGKSWRVTRRRAAQRRLANAMYHWSRIATQHDPVSRARYRDLRARGKSHGHALRVVGDRLLAVACTMLQNGTFFDPQHRTVTT